MTSVCGAINPIASSLRYARAIMTRSISCSRTKDTD